MATQLNTIPDEKDLVRQMHDQATRVGTQDAWQRRSASVQRLMARINALSDSEFETAMAALESMVENFNARKLRTDNKEQSEKEAGQSRAEVLKTIGVGAGAPTGTASTGGSVTQIRRS